MALKIGSQPISCDGKEALQAVVNGLTKSAKRPVDLSSLKVRIKRGADGSVIELVDGDILELSANVAAPKPPVKMSKAADKK